MTRYKSNLKNIVNNHSFILSLQLFYLGVLSFSLFDSALVVKEIVNLFDFVNISYLKNPIVSCLFAFKTISNISGFYALIVLSFELIAVFLIVSAFLILFIHCISSIRYNKTKVNYNNNVKIAVSNLSLYKFQSKYLC